MANNSFLAEVTFKWTKYCVFSAAGVDNVNDTDSSKIISTIKDTKLYVPVVAFSVIDSQKLLKLLSKGFEISVYWNEYKTKSENKNATNEFRYFVESNFVGVNRLFVLVYSNQGSNVKRFNVWKYYLPKGIIKSYNVIISGNFYDQVIDPDIKQYEDIRKLTTGQGEDDTTGCLLDYDYIKNHYRLTLIWVGTKILKLVRILLETWTLVHNTHM